MTVLAATLFSSPVVTVAFNVSVSPKTVSGSGRNQVTTNLAYVSATGGTPPYSFQWSSQSGWTVTNPDRAQTTFSTIASSDGVKDAAFRCIVRDATGAQVTAPAVTAVVTWR